MDFDLKRCTQNCLALARRTGEILLRYWRQPTELSIQKKTDGTPATAADLAAHLEITSGLKAIAPDFPVLSEEGEWPDYAERAKWGPYWLVDPLDGTRGFIARLEQFSINIALIVDHQPVLGVIYSPASATFYYAWQGGGTYKQIGAQAPQRLRTPAKTDSAPWRIVIGQYSRGKRLLQLINQPFPLSTASMASCLYPAHRRSRLLGMTPVSWGQAGENRDSPPCDPPSRKESSLQRELLLINNCEYQLLHANGSVKFGWLAEGRADLYPRLGPISEWDTAAGQCILTECGGAVVDLQGRSLQYNRKPSLLNPEFIALADASWTEYWLKIFVH